MAEIKNYIERDSVYYANKTIADILRRIENLKLFPSMGRYVPEFNSKEMRELIYKSYRILYTFNSKNIQHTNRQNNLGCWTSKLCT